MKNLFQHSRIWDLAALATIASMTGCGDDKVSFTDLGVSGGASGWTFVPPGSDESGSGGTANPGGSSSGGALGHAGPVGPGGAVGGAGSAAVQVAGSASVGVAGSGGSAMVAPVTFKCEGKLPNQPVITHFDGFMGDRWTSPGNLDGGVYVYPDPLQPAAGEFLRFANRVEDYAGIGVWFSGCIDGSKFRGLRFTIAGNVGPGGTVQFYIVSNRNKVVNEADSAGACVPADPDDTWQSCRAPVVTLAVSNQPTTVAVPWTAFKAGLPSATTDGSDLIALQWSFEWQDDATPYAAMLTIDDLEFFTDGAGTGANGAGN
jgi:hypothetical protein